MSPGHGPQRMVPINGMYRPGVWPFFRPLLTPATFLFTVGDSLGRMANYTYRIRGYYKKSEKESFITRTRYKTKGEAEANKDLYGPTWTKIRVVKM